MPALRNPVHESLCRDVAGGMSEYAAWRAAGNNSRNSTRFFKRPEIIARVAELRAQFNERSAISLAHLQEQLLGYTKGDVTDYLEPRPYTDGKLRIANLKALPPEMRARIAEVSFDKDGNINFRLHDKTKAIETLIRSIAGPETNVDVAVAVELGSRLDAARAAARARVKLGSGRSVLPATATQPSCAEGVPQFAIGDEL